MAYTPPTDSGSDGYSMVLKHNASGLLIEVTLAGVADGVPQPTRAIKDSVFQGAVDRLTAIPGTTLMSACRSINYGSDITPT